MSEQLPPEVVIWQLGGKPTAVKSQNSYATNSGFTLYCSANKEYLTYGKEPLGINLVFAKNGTDKKVHFRLPDGQERQILTGEPVAFGVGGGDAFLRYAVRTTGINLEWSNQPVFEWVFCGQDGQKGIPIDGGHMYAMLNLRVEPDPDFLIYLDRVPGQADVGWTTSPNWPGKVLSAVNKYKGAAKWVATLAAA
jgi:hypothetical protein